MTDRRRPRPSDGDDPAGNLYLPLHTSATLPALVRVRAPVVVVPYSPPPRSRRYSAVAPSTSVGNGPVPTREVKAFATPTMSVKNCGPTPAPTEAAPATQSLDVPNG